MGKLKFGTKSLEKSLKACVRFRWKQRKTVPYDDLDHCLYIVEKYLQLAKGIELFIAYNRFADSICIQTCLYRGRSHCDAPRTRECRCQNRC